MNTLRWVLCLMVILVASCVTTEKANINRDDPVFIQGFEDGVKVAKDERVTIDCNNPRLGSLPIKRAKRHGESLQTEGHPEAYVWGFKEGYRKETEDILFVMCN